MKTKIFAYKTFIGAETDIDNGTFLNDPKKVNQLGCIVPIGELEITKEAKDLLFKAKRESGSFAQIMITRLNGGNSNIGLMGFGKHAFDTSEPVISSDCDLTILDDIPDSIIELPKDFIAFIDSL